MSILIAKKEPLATKVKFDDDRMYVFLEDGREIGVSLDWFPKLKNATLQQRENWRLIGNGVGIHWESIDEDISIRALLTK